MKVWKMKHLLRVGVSSNEALPDLIRNPFKQLVLILRSTSMLYGLAVDLLVAC